MKSTVPSRSAQLRQLLRSSELALLMEAHNGLSVRIAREAGFRGIWASGLSISAQFGVRDNNEASWTQAVDVLEFMADASDLPILLQLHDDLKAKGFVIYAEQGDLSQSLFRISTMGELRAADIERPLNCFARFLN